MNCDKLGAVREGSLDLNFVNHFRYSLHHIGSSENFFSKTHHLGHGFSIPGALHDFGCDECDGFGMIEFHTTITPPPGYIRSHDNEELFLFAR